PHAPRSASRPYTTLFRSDCDTTGWPAAGRGEESGCVALNGRTALAAANAGAEGGLTIAGSFEPGLASAVAVARGLLTPGTDWTRSEEHTSELQSRENLVC